jgi:hypothetical protein
VEIGGLPMFGIGWYRRNVAIDGLVGEGEDCKTSSKLHSTAFSLHLAKLNPVPRHTFLQ